MYASQVRTGLTRFTQSQRACRRCCGRVNMPLSNVTSHWSSEQLVPAKGFSSTNMVGPLRLVSRHDSIYPMLVLDCAVQPNRAESLRGDGTFYETGDTPSLING